MNKYGSKTILDLVTSLITKKEIEFGLKILEEYHFEKSLQDKVNYLKAICYIKSERRDYNKALKLLEEIKPENKTSDWEYLKYFVHFKMEDYETIVKYHLANEDIFENLNENFQMIVAISYEKLNLIQNSKILYKKITSFHPNNKEAINNLTILEIKGSNSSESVGFLKNCYRNFPQNLSIANNYALCLIKNKMIDEGLKIFEKILKENTKNSSKEKILLEKIKRNFFHHLIKLGKEEYAESLIKNQISDEEIIESAKYIFDAYISNGKLFDANEFLKNLEKESQLSKNEKFQDQLRKLTLELENLNKIKKKQNGTGFCSKPLIKKIEIFKAADFTIENIDLSISKLNISKIEDNSKIDNRIETENKLNKSKIIELNETCVATLTTDLIQAKKDSREKTNAKQSTDSISIFNSTICAETDHNSPDTVLKLSENKRSIDDSYILERFHNIKTKTRKQAKDLNKINQLEDTNFREPISRQEMLQKILNANLYFDFINCRGYITEYREKFKINEDFGLDIALVSAKLYYDNKEYSSVVGELKNYYKILDEKNLQMLLSSSKQMEHIEDYLNFLEEFYIKYNTDKETLFELLAVCVGLSQMNKAEKLIDKYFDPDDKAQAYINNISDYEKIINILLSNSNFLDSTHTLIDKMKTLFGITPIYYYYLGRYNLKKDNVNQAFENFLKIGSKMDAKPEFRKYLGKIYFKLGNLGYAIKTFKQALRLDNYDWNSALLIVKCLIYQDEYQKASKYINVACKIHPNSEISLKIKFSKGLLSYNLKQFAEALNYFNACIKLSSSNFKVLHYIALIHLEYYEINAAQILFEQILKQNENYFPSLFELIKIKLFLNKPDEVKDVIHKIENFVENNYSPNLQQYSIEYAVIIAKYYSDYNKAMKYFECAVKKGRHTVINQAIIFADTLHSKQESARAIKCYQILLELCKKDYRMFKGLKNIFASMKRYDEAAKTITTYIKHNPNSIEAYADLGDLYFLKQNYNRALDYFALANNLNKIISDNKFNYVKKKIALCRIYLKLHETAFKNFEDYSTIKIEENIYLLMAFLKVLYFDNLEEANSLLEVFFAIFNFN